MYRLKRGWYEQALILCALAFGSCYELVLTLCAFAFGSCALGLAVALLLTGGH